MADVSGSSVIDYLIINIDSMQYKYKYNNQNINVIGLFHRDKNQDFFHSGLTTPNYCFSIKKLITIAKNSFQ